MIKAGKLQDIILLKGTNIFFQIKVKHTGCDVFWALKDKIWGYFWGYAEKSTIKKRKD